MYFVWTFEGFLRGQYGNRFGIRHDIELSQRAGLFQINSFFLILSYFTKRAEGATFCQLFLKFFSLSIIFSFKFILNKRIFPIEWNSRTCRKKIKFKNVFFLSKKAEKSRLSERAPVSSLFGINISQKSFIVGAHFRPNTYLFM